VILDLHPESELDEHQNLSTSRGSPLPKVTKFGGHS